MEMLKDYKMDKIIKEEGRLILIKKELIKEEYWLDVLNSLTFAEGMAFGSAMQTWSERFNKHIRLEK